MQKKKNTEHFKKSREKILTDSFKLFAKYGYANLKTRQLARLLGQTTGVIYYYFKSKEELFCEMIVLLGQKDILEGVNSLKEAKTQKEKLYLLLKFVESKSSYFKDLVNLMTDCFRNTEALKVERALLKKIFLNYMKSIDTHLDLKNVKNSSFILSYIIGEIVQSQITSTKLCLNLNNVWPIINESEN